MIARSLLTAVAAVVIATGRPGIVEAQQANLTKVTWSLDFVASGRHAPWYAALARGYFKDEGLDVTIIQGQGSAQVIQAVESGVAQFGFVDVPSLALARSAGSKIRILAVNYQKAPYAVFSLADGANVTTLKQLEGLTLGSGAGSFTPKIIHGFMIQKGLDPQKLTISNIAPPARASALLSRNTPAIEFFIMAKPGLEKAARAANTELRTLLLANEGLVLYSNGIAATEDYLAKNPDVAKRFVRAALKGWKFALDNPAEAAGDQRKYVPSLDPDLIKAEIEVIRDLAVTPDTKANGLGWFDPAKIAASVDFAVKYIGVTGSAPKPEDLIAPNYLPSPAIKP